MLSTEGALETPPVHQAPSLHGFALENPMEGGASMDDPWGR